LLGVRIQRPEVSHKVGFKENPAFSRFCPLNLAAFGLLAEHGGRHAQERGGLLEIQRDIIGNVHKLRSCNE
jgi:hypothetical protein